MSNGGKVSMEKFFSPNITRAGRVIRGVFGAGLVAAALLLSSAGWRIRLALVAAGLFAFYEAARGWCIMRACGIKTKW